MMTEEASTVLTKTDYHPEVIDLYVNIYGPQDDHTMVIFCF